MILEMKDGSVILTIKDDGRGIPDEALARMGSLGILGMRERALAFGGGIEIVGVPGGGTTVTATIPLVADRSSQGRENQ